MSDSLSLYRLQTLDTEIDQIEIRLKEIIVKLNDDARVKRTQQNLEKAKDKSKQVRIELNQIEDKVEAQRIKRKTTQASLFSGNVKNPKALQDLQMESEALKRYIAQLEEKQLEAMIAYEEAQSTEEHAENEHAEAQSAAATENAVLSGENSNLEEKFARLLREKEAVIQAIPSETLKLYTRLRKAKRGTAVAVVSDGGCSICGQSLTPADLQSIRAASSRIFCPSCGRILFQG